MLKLQVMKNVDILCEMLNFTIFNFFSHHFPHHFSTAFLFPIIFCPDNCSFFRRISFASLMFLYTTWGHSLEINTPCAHQCNERYCTIRWRLPTLLLAYYLPSFPLSSPLPLCRRVFRSFCLSQDCSFAFFLQAPVLWAKYICAKVKKTTTLKP